MYGPTAARPKKTNISRTRSGCAACRRKRRKCDERKPSCGRCAGTGSTCEYGANLEFRDATQWAANKVKRRTKQSRLVAAVNSNSNSVSPPGPSPGMLTDGGPSPVDSTSPELPLQAQSVLPGGEAAMYELNPRSAGREGSSQPEGILPEWLPLAGADLEYASMCLDGQWLAVQQLSSARVQDMGMGGAEPAFQLPTLHDPTSPAKTAYQLRGSMLDHDPWGALSLSFQDGLGPEVWDLDPDLVASSSESHQSPNAVDLTRDNGENLDVVAATTPTATCSLTNCPVSPRPIAIDRVNHRRQSASTQGSSLGLAGRVPWPPSSGSIPRPLPSPDVAVGDRLYLAHFRVNLTDVLPLQLDSLFNMTLSLPPVRYAAMALAAANLANQQGKQSPDPKGTWLMVPSHADHAAKFMTQSVATRQVDPKSDLKSSVVMQILSVCYHLEIGSVADMRDALATLDQTVLSYSSQILALPCGRDMIRCWLHLRSLSGLSENPHAPYGDESHIEPLVLELERFVATPQDVIGFVGTKALQICHRILLLNCMRSRGDTAKETMKKSAKWWAILKGGDGSCCPPSGPEDLTHILDEEDLYRELDSLRSWLDECEAPEEFPSNLEQPGSLPQMTGTIEPLRFHSHSRAMICADYAFARLICDTNLVRALLQQPVACSETEQSQDPRPAKQSTPWLHLLFRIALGLDPVECVKRNMYRKGITAYLYFSTLFTVGSAGFDLLDSFLWRFIKAGIFYESSLQPLRAFSSFVKALNRETSSKGRTVFMACLTYHAWTLREKLFSNATDQYLMIYGRELDGRYFNDLVPMVDG